MGRGKRRELTPRERDAVVVFSNVLAGGSPLHPLERPFDAAEASACLPKGSKVEVRTIGRWLYLTSPGSAEERDYRVVGKYLFFAPEPEALVPAACRAIALGFHDAKISRYRGGYPNYVLCVYWRGDERLEEMRLLASELGLAYGGWKTDAQTRAEAQGL